MFTVTVVDTPAALQPDINLMTWSTTVEAHGFTGHYDNVSIWLPDYDIFLHNLILLEQKRQGEATLTSASPEELVLTLKSADRLGHMMIEGQLGQYTYVANKLYIQKLLFAFQFDPTELPTLVKSFTDLVRS